ncbi:monovalent cation:proton antiporter family protein [Thalassomonas sp. M1454]|uniref:monovalent cation:proton antiporter family protein n=1 Tax=Thalassomonas sp. M1454 TaxID=2594477 RepID=UPI00117C1000|nr:monovalent cation:proton antiporter family protein [Thalassomonas sp. M1454]TRX55643.1 potassium transporter [Thalassomonas sp. M1454]
MGHFFEILAILVAAVFTVWIFRKLHLPAILAYLVAGTIVGEYGLGLTGNHLNYEHFAELGIVFLLFTLGLEFSLPKLLAMRHLVMGVGSKQFLLTLLAFLVISLLLGFSIEVSLVIGGALALSSTAIVIRQLNDSGSIKRKSGQISVAILLFQDIAVVPLLIIIPFLSDNGDSSMLLALLFALLKGVFVVALLLSVGKWLLPRLFNQIAQVRTDELFVLSTLLVTLMAAALTQFFGLSMALGAFLAGMMLGESQYKHQLEADIRPFRDILLGLFFITVGMKLDPSLLITSPGTIAILVIGFMLIKIAIIRYLAVKAGESSKDAWASAFMLAQMGEFSFVLISLAANVDVLTTEVTSILLGSGIISMALTPYMIKNARKWAVSLSYDGKQQEIDLEQQNVSKNLSDHVVICGFGRVGQTVSRFLKQEKIEFVAIDIDPLRVSESREAGENVLFGSARQTEILAAANLKEAKLVVISYGAAEQSLDVVQKVRSISTDVQILVRTRNDDALVALKEAGANEVVPESLEGSLMLVSQVLNLTGVPFSRVIRRIQTERKSHYHRLHGFYPGVDTDMSADAIEQREFVHAILLTDDAWANGRALKDLDITRRRVDIASIRRGDDEFNEVHPSFVLQAQDTVILQGKPRRVERIERYLQEGP